MLQNLTEYESRNINFTYNLHFNIAPLAKHFI